MLEILVVLGLILVAIGLPVLMVRGVMQMWRDKDRSGSVSSGIAGAMSELDRVVRPSVEHVLEAKKLVKKEEESGEPPS